MGKKLTEIKLQPDAALAAVIGKGKITRPQATKKIWAYFKAHRLQDKKNKRMINANETLKPIFGKKQISMFEVGSLLGKHLK